VWVNDAFRNLRPLHGHDAGGGPAGCRGRLFRPRARPMRSTTPHAATRPRRPSS
jgi:hypothetical protein